MPTDSSAEEGKSVFSGLRESEEGFRALADACPFAIMIYQDDRWVYVNEAAEGITGYSRSELYRQNFWELVHPEHQGLVRERGFKRQAGLNPPSTYDFKIIHKSGSVRWVTLSAGSFVYQGRFAGLNTVVDITERKRAEEALRENRQQMAQIIEFLPDATFGIDTDGRIIIWNRAMEEMTGIAAGEMMGKSAYEYAVPFYGRRRPILVDRILDPAIPIESEYPFINRQGRSLSTEVFCPALYNGKGAYVFAKAAPLNDAEGAVIGAIESVRDISERMRAESELRRNEEKYRSILENIEDGYYEVDLAGNFTFFNDFTCRISGYPPHELLGMNYRQYTDADNAAKLKQTFMTVYQTGRPARALDLAILQKSGERNFVEISTSLMVSGAGEPEGFRGIIRDITERKTAEEQKARLEAQLQQAQKMEAVGTLAGGVAHDFNNILQAISGYTQLMLMKKTPEDPDYRKLQQIQKSGNRAAGLIEQLLTFSRKIEGQCRPLCLNQEIRLVDKLLKQTIPKMIDRRLDLEEPLWLVNADPVHMEQILLNLGSNAADAMPEGGELFIETRNVILDEASGRPADAPPGRYVRLCVSDTGWGMDEKTLEQIFEPFFTTKAIGKGTGLGLASVYGIVKSHGGHITCESRINQGTTFRIHIPALPESEARAPCETAGARPRGGTETILVVDDEIGIREAEGEILERFGYRVVWAEDAETAVSIYRRQWEAIDLVILDLNMPGMGGLQCLKELLARHPAARIIIASGYAEGNLPAKALAAGACGFISKPCQADELAAAVRRALDTA
jgi:PAS domain S-box-containing protein